MFPTCVCFWEGFDLFCCGLMGYFSILMYSCLAFEFASNGSIPMQFILRTNKFPNLRMKIRTSVLMVFVSRLHLSSVQWVMHGTSGLKTQMFPSNWSKTDEFACMHSKKQFVQFFWIQSRRNKFFSVI
jgi:hypothetical protein